jgi:hypothetical protein
MQQSNNIEYERLTEIEMQRGETFADQKFIKWFQEMKIGSRLSKQIPKPERHHFDMSKAKFQFKF